MSDTVFNSAFWFENNTYEEHEEATYSNKKQIRDNFKDFLIESLKEAEFKKNKKKSKNNNICYEYQFEEKKKHKIRVLDDADGIHIIALYENDINEDIDEEMVDKDKGEIFRHLMDRIMDALEVIECTIFDIETKTQTNLSRTAIQIKKGKKIAAKKSSGRKKRDASEDFEPESSEEEEEEEEEEDDVSESEEEDEVSKRRSKRLKSRKIKITNKNGKILRKKRKRNIKSDEESESDEESKIEEPKRKKRKLNKAEKRAMKREFVKSWVNKEYVEAIHFVEDEYHMTANEINDLIESIYDNDL